MSLSSSIEFEPNVGVRRPRDTSDATAASPAVSPAADDENEEEKSKQAKVRLSYEYSKWENTIADDTPISSIAKPYHEAVVILSTSQTSSHTYLQPRTTPAHNEREQRSDGRSPALRVGSRKFSSDGVTETAPFPSLTSAASGDGHSAAGENDYPMEKGNNGALIIVNGDEDDVESDQGDQFPVATHVDEIVDTREPDRFGFLGGSGKEVTIPVEVFRRRESKWLEMLDNWQFYMTKRFDKVRVRCRKGIPSSLRPRAWKYLCGAQFFMTSNVTKHIFEALDKHPGDPQWNSEIAKDLNRQFPNHELFSQATPYGKFGQEDLFRILKAWTLLHPEEGYCQAQAPIAAALLMHMPAHEAFYCFAQICQKYLPGYFSPGLEAIQLDGDILFGLLKKHSYSSYKHLKKQNIDPVLYMVEWFMCIFCRTLPWPCVLRVLDMFFCEGAKVLFKVGVFLFKYGLNSREHLRACPTMYETIERLRHLPVENLNEEYLVQKVAEMNITDEDLERVHYKQIKARNKKQKQKRGHVTI